VNRLLVYSFVCTPGGTTVAQWVAGGPLPTHYGSPNGTIWLPAEEDFTLQAEDSWFCESSMAVVLPQILPAHPCLPQTAVLLSLARGCATELTLVKFLLLLDNAHAGVRSPAQLRTMYGHTPATRRDPLRVITRSVHVTLTLRRRHLFGQV
jgi:hypothetical protein